MKNRWVSLDNPMASWVADLSTRRHNAESLLSWLRSILTAGDECAVYSVDEAPTAGFRRAIDGSLTDYIERQFNASMSIDLFQFARSGMRPVNGSRFKVSARMAYVDADGRIAESDIDDLGMLLRNLRPADVASAGSRMSRCPPIEITGPKIDFGAPERSIWTPKPDQVKVRFNIYSDIWFPWVRGLLEDKFDVNSWHDNRSLTQFHSPRLNRFLESAAEATRACGGTWELDEEDSRVMAWMLTDTGIRLDVEPPGVMTYKE